MRSNSQPIRLDAELTATAKTAANAMSRSLADQISHWARLGRELERSPDLSVRDIQRVLAGAADYDALGTREQALVRTEWSARMRSLREGLQLDQEFRKAGYRYAELDTNGEVAERTPRRAKRKVAGK
jgi:hypothetical protein